MKQTFEQLIAEASKFMGCKEPQRLIAGESLVMNDVGFAFIRHEDTDPDRIFLFASFGKVPIENQAAVLEALLEENHSVFNGHGAAFSISPVTGQVVYAHQVPIANTRPAELAATVRYLITIGTQWRETYFLDKPVTASGSRRPGFLQPSA
jgi:hypothetical protein